MLHILLEPLELLASERTQATSLEIEHVHEPDEVHAAVVEAIPAAGPCCALRRLSVAIEILTAIVGANVVLPRHEKHILRARVAQHLISGIELRRLRELADVAGVQQKCRRYRKRVDLRDRGLHRRRHIGVCCLVEADVAVADLDEEEISILRRAGTEQAGLRNASTHRPEQTSTCPCHAIQKAATVDVAGEDVGVGAIGCVVVVGHVRVRGSRSLAVSES